MAWIPGSCSRPGFSPGPCEATEKGAISTCASTRPTPGVDSRKPITS